MGNKKLEHYSVDTPRAYDRDLMRIFSNNPRHSHSPPAANFIRHYRQEFRQLISKWTGAERRLNRVPTFLNRAAA